jgi:transglutaminase-like putative cysteine protease
VAFYDGGPQLRAHQVRTLDDRVAILRRMAWLGDAAFGRRNPPIGGLKDPRMRQIGLEVTRGCPARSDSCELNAIYEFVKQNVRYTGDITDKDTFQTAWRTLQMAGGDCDDAAILNAVLAMENGFQTRFRITSNTGATWDHIYCLAGVPKNNPRQWVALDTTLPGRHKFGVHPPQAKHRDFDVTEP